MSREHVQGLSGRMAREGREGRDARARTVACWVVVGVVVVVVVVVMLCRARGRRDSMGRGWDLRDVCVRGRRGVRLRREAEARRCVRVLLAAATVCLRLPAVWGACVAGSSHMTAWRRWEIAWEGRWRGRWAPAQRGRAAAAEGRHSARGVVSEQSSRAAELGV